MGMLGLAQPLGISTPKTSAQIPHSVYVNYTDRVSKIDVDSYRLESPGNTPARFIFIVVDQTNTVGSSIAVGQRVMWVDNVNSRTLFQGHIRYIRPTISGPWAKWECECFDLSEVLDRTLTVNEVRPAETDQQRIDYLVGKAGFSFNVSGVTSNATISAATMSKETLRASIERALAAAAVGADYAIDNLGNLSTWVGNPATTAPYAITDVSPTNTPGGATIAAEISSELDDSLSADAVYVYGGNAAGSGLVYSTVAAPNWPLRINSVDAPYCNDAATLAAVGAAEINARTALQRATIKVIGFDGWQRGQTLSVTNAVLGWSAKQLVIQGVNMTVKSGTGIREYELSCGSPAPSMSKDMAAAIAAARSGRAQGVMPGSTNEGSTINPTGWTSGLAIIDGVNDAFKIIATGTMSVATVNGDRNIQQQVTLSGLGAQTSTPVNLSQVGSSNASTGNRWVGYMAEGLIDDNMWVAASSGASPTFELINIGPLEWGADVRVGLDGSNNVVVTLHSSNQSGAGHTAFARYYVMAETGI